MVKLRFLCCFLPCIFKIGVELHEIYLKTDEHGFPNVVMFRFDSLGVKYEPCLIIDFVICDRGYLLMDGGVGEDCVTGSAMEMNDKLSDRGYLLMDGGVGEDCLTGSAMEMNDKLRFVSVDNFETELCRKNMAEEVLLDSKMEHVTCQEMDVCNDFELGTSTGRDGRDVIVDITKTDCSAAGETKQISENTELLQSSVTINDRDAADLAKSNPRAETQVEGAMGCTGVPICSLPEPFCENQSIEESDCVKSSIKEALNGEKLVPDEVLNDSAMEPSAENHAIRVLDGGDLEHCCVTIEVKEAANDFMSNHCPSDKAEETSNDDVYSEVLNPNPSPKHLSSSLTSSSQPLDVLASDPGGCGEITSACSQTSSADGNSCKEKHVQNSTSESVSTSCVAIEIPKNISTTGIRKITFKFSKRKEDYDSKISFPCKPMVNNEFQEDHSDIHSCLSASQPSTCADPHKWSCNTRETINGNEYADTPSPLSCAPNREMKMSKKIFPENYPTNVKKLLSTKILEGARVKYVSVSEKKEIPGIIKDCGYLCGCSLCNFSKVVSAYEFELHTGTKTRHPNNHIYLENGKPIYAIVEELRTASLTSLDDVLKAVAGSSVNEEYFQVWKANLQYANTVSCGDGPYLSKPFYQKGFINSQPIEDGPCADLGFHHEVPVNQQSYTEVAVEQKRLIKKPRNNQSFSVWEKKKAIKGGSKKRDNDLHKLLFMPNGLPDGTDLAYYAKGKRILGGYKQGNGIICSCCNTELSPSQFEAHAGWSAKRQPYRHIYTSSGLTLHDIALMLANGQSLVTGGSDDMCAVCGDGGKLIICNGCPRAFHAACLGLQSLPGSDWHCHYCIDKVGPGSKTSRESKPIILRLTRVVKAPEFESGGCVVCRSQDFSAVKFDDLTVILCDQCEKEYHVGCLRERGMCDLKELPNDKWFCCDDCDKIFNTLQLLTSSGPEVIPTSMAAAIFRKHAAVGLNNIALQWHILSGKSRQPEHLLLLSQAAAIFRECFDPIVAKSGRDLIPVMVYGRNIAGQEFSGMYCVVLMVNSIVISAALLRIFGREAAELPLVATSKNNQGKGFFLALFSCIEGFLYSMNVKHIVLPAAEEAEPMWMKKLGFTRTSQEQMLRYTRDLQLTIFKGTSLLEKEVKEQRG